VPRWLEVQLEEALKNANSNNNIVLKEGDKITIPKTRDLVIIHTIGTKSKEVNVQLDSLINVPYFAGKDAKYYIEQYTGGLYRDKQVKWKDVYVSNPNGRISKSKNYILFKTFPKVEKGSEIRVALQQRKKEDEPKKRKDPDSLEKTIQRTTMLASLVTLVLGMVSALRAL
jgi:hypothetical protein